MKVIILCAGLGSRLRPHTDNRPKCMVEVADKPIVRHQLDLFAEFGIKEITLVTGYKADVIPYDDVAKIHNRDYDSTNMLHSLFLAKELFLQNEDILVSYGDIIYTKEVLQKIIDADGACDVVVDKGFKPYWYARAQEPLEDLETLRLDDKGFICDIGNTPRNIEEIQGQYIGLFKFSKTVTKEVYDFYASLSDTGNMYVTAFLQALSQNGFELTPVFIHNGWIEIDTPDDMLHTNFLRYGKEYFITEEFLHRINTHNGLEKGDFPRMEKLCKKIDVVKKIYQVYERDLTQAATCVEISAKNYNLLLRTLGTLAMRYNDLKYLNSALKLQDTLQERGILSKHAKEEVARCQKELLV